MNFQIIERFHWGFNNESLIHYNSNSVTIINSDDCMYKIQTYEYFHSVDVKITSIITIKINAIEFMSVMFGTWCYLDK